MRGSGSRWPGALATLLWTGLVLVGVGPALMELLDGHGLTGTLSGLPVLVTESVVIGLLLIGPRRSFCGVCAGPQSTLIDQVRNSWFMAIESVFCVPRVVRIW